MRELLLLLVHFLVAVARLLGPGGARALVAENLVIKHQLLVLARSRRRSPNLRPRDRVLLGFWSLFVRRARIEKVAVALRPATLLAFHQALVRRKYRALFSPKRRGTPDPKGPRADLVQAIIELKRRNSRFGCRRIALIIARTFGVELDKDVVRRVLSKHYRPSPCGGGPSWLTFIGHAKDSLWSVDLFRCESILLRSHWVLIVMDQFTRRIIGFAVHPGDVDGQALCRMFNRVIARQPLPEYLSTDRDPLFRYHRWEANLRILGIEAIKSVPFTPTSHPFVERPIGTVRREFLDHTLFWNSVDLETKLLAFQDYFNLERVHSALAGATPDEVGGREPEPRADLHSYRWRSHCRDLYCLPAAV